MSIPFAALSGVASLALGLGLLLARPLSPPDLGAPARLLAAPAPLDGAYGALVVDLRSHAVALPPDSAPVVASLEPTPQPPETTASAEQALRPSLAPSAQPAPQIAEAAPLVDAPLPPRRPGELNATASLVPPSQQAPGRRMARAEPRTVVPAQPADNRSFLEKFFGVGAPASQQPPRAAVAYAATPDSGGFFSAARSVAPSLAAPPRADNQTAVYDISTHTVYLPNGTRLEAHSGLRERLDDPRYVHERMRGATPPAVYDLRLREALFHGVQALRLTPISGTTYGRSGLLAHTYMLGPKDDSNGCVSFRDYQAFLRAYQNGEIRRLAVVAHAN